MRKSLCLVIIALLVLALSACGGATTPTAGAPSALPVDFEDAASLRNQVALGILRLEGSSDAVDADQAAELLPLWQTLQVLTTSSTASPTEMEALQDQIVATLTQGQVAAIAAMRVTNADLQAYYVEIGVQEVRTPEPGVTPQGSALKDLPPEQREAARATAQALGTPMGNRGGSNGAIKRDALMENVIALLADRAEAQ